MKRFIGKRVKVKASFVCIDRKFATPKALFHNISVDGTYFSSHAWINVSDKFVTKALVGDVIEGTAMLTEYIGLDGDKVVKKLGFKNLKVREIR